MFWWILAVSLCVAFIYHRASLKERLLVNSRIKRMLRWEYWPSYILYLPVALYSLRLACKHKCLTAFYVANPGLYHGGMYGEKKSLALQQIGEQFPDAIAETLLIPTDLPYKRVEHSLRTRHEKNWHYPVVLKPDHGFRGKQVMIIRNDSQLAEYLNRFSAPCLMQPYIEGLEFGIFYCRHPDSETGTVFSLAEKTFPTLTGDGKSTLEMLILADSHACFFADFFIDKFKTKRKCVLKEGEIFNLVEIGSHCRGSVFLDRNHWITPALSEHIDRIAKSIPEFYFGRFDIRVDTLENLQDGKHLRIIEVNGVTAEAAHIYDPKNSFFTASSTLLKQWSMAYEIGSANISRGFEAPSVSALLQEIRSLSKNA